MSNGVGDNTESVELGMLDCGWCGDTYDATKSDALDKTEYCSQKCEEEEAASQSLQDSEEEPEEDDLEDEAIDFDQVDRDADDEFDNSLFEKDGA